MKTLIIPEDRVEKLRSMKFEKNWHTLNPVEGELDGKPIYFLQAELKDNETFNEALSDFEVCEIKDIEIFEDRYYDEKGAEISEAKIVQDKLSKVELVHKTILIQSKLNI